MSFIAVLDTEMKTCGKRMKDLACEIHVAQNTISTWLNRGEVPPGIIGKLIKAVNKPRLSMKWMEDLEGNIFSTPYLENVDKHPIIAAAKAFEEIDEWKSLYSQYQKILFNKKPHTKFSSDDEVIVQLFEDQTADVLTAMKMTLVRNQEYYDRQVEETIARHKAKLKDRGYCETTEKAACVGAQTALG